MRDRLIELLEDTLSEWECYATDITIKEMADHLLANGVIVPKFKFGERIWVIDYDGGDPTSVGGEMYFSEGEDFIISSAFIDDYDAYETVEEHIEETQKNWGTELMVHRKSDCFSTREEAEKALAEREGKG
jgi:hypothetical protein